MFDTLGGEGHKKQSLSRMKIDVFVQSRNESSLPTGGIAVTNIQLVILPVDDKGRGKGVIMVSPSADIVDQFSALKTGSKVTLSIDPSA